MSPAATARRLCSLTLLASVLCFTPKPSAHCLLWGSDFPLTPLPTEASAASSSPEPSPSLPAASPSSPSSSPASSTTPPDDSPPPVLCRSHSCAAASPVGEGSFHLPLGALAPSGECIPLAAPMPAAAADAAAVRAAPRLGGVEVAARAAECDVWWREVSEDVIPPVPELVLPLGATPHGSRLALCRTRAEAEGGGGVPRMGTLAVEGPDFGKCFFTREDGGRGVIEGGNFHVLQARPQEPECVDVPAEAERLRRQLLQRVEAYVPPAARREIEAVAEVPFGDLLAGASSLGSCDLSQILSAARFVPHELNAKGLHGLRAVLAEEMAHARAVARGYDAHPLYATWRRDGILRLNMDDLDDAAIHKLLQVVSGEETEGIPLPPYRWIDRNVTVTAADPQHKAHMDTFAPIVKVWVFPADTSLSQGPLHFAAGSQHNSPSRLRWMHAYSLPPATEAMREPSFRLLGSAAAAAAAPDFIRQTQASMAAVLPLPFASRTLVIADTSGLHHRGPGVVGAVRRSSRLPGDNDGGLPRLHPFRMPHGATEDAA